MLITSSCRWMPEGARVRQCRAASHLVTPTNRAKARPIKHTLLPNTARFDVRSHGPVTRTPPSEQAEFQTWNQPPVLLQFLVRMSV